MRPSRMFLAIVLAAGLSVPAMAVEKQGTVAIPGKAESAKTFTRNTVPGGLKGNVGTTAGVAELTAEECTKLGGTVYDTETLCKSGKYCGRADESGARHRVCLEVAQ